MEIPNKAYYCTRHKTLRDNCEECYWYRKNNKCLVGKPTDKCDAIQVCVAPCSINPELVSVVEAMLERYENADPPMDGIKFAKRVIEIARGVPQ